MSYNQTLNYIYNLKGSEHKGNFNLSLDNIKILLKKLDNPEKSLKVIHVTGTNGKGSVCTMIASILMEKGHKVGIYTSPHLKDFRERFVVNNKKISKRDFVKYFEIIKPNITNQTFFEVITSIAFLYFKDKKTDFLVCEVGLGGRLDATNVVNPLVSVITKVGLEHQEYLGDTIERIAYEKAGIIKNNKPVVTGAKGAALKVIKEIAKKKNSPIFLIKKAIKKNSHFNINDYKNLKLSLMGDFQLENASIAVKTIEVLNKYYNLNINKNNIRKGLLKTKIAGRFQFISRNIIVDCAHNPDAMAALKKELLKIRKRYRKIYLIIGILKDKDYKAMLDKLIPLVKTTILVKPKIPRAQDPKILAKYVKKNYIIIENAKNAFKYIKKKTNKNDLILVTGSFYVVGEII